MAVASDESLREWARTDLDVLRHEVADFIHLAERFPALEDASKQEARTELERLAGEIAFFAPEIDSQIVLYVDCLPGVWGDEVRIAVANAEAAANTSGVTDLAFAIECLRTKVGDIESTQRQICGTEFQQAPVLEPVPSDDWIYHRGAIALSVLMGNLARWEIQRQQADREIRLLDWLIISREAICEFLSIYQRVHHNREFSNVKILSVDRKPVRLGATFKFHHLEVQPSYHHGVYMTADCLVSCLSPGVFDNDEEWSEERCLTDDRFADSVADAITSENLVQVLGGIAWLKDFDWDFIKNGLPGEYECRTRNTKDNDRNEPAREQDDGFRDAGWFTRNTAIPPARLWMAAGKQRKTKRVRRIERDGVTVFSLKDAEQHWPDDFSKRGATLRKPAQI